MSKKSDILILLGLSLVVVAIAVVIIVLLSKSFKDSSRRADETCQQIAQVANSPQWERDTNYNCYILKDGKLVKVNT